jgi:hypothetical protein
MTEPNTNTQDTTQDTSASPTQAPAVNPTPTTPAVPPATVAASAQPAAVIPTPTVQPAAKPTTVPDRPMSHDVFKSVLQVLGGGPRSYVKRDPISGVNTTVVEPQTKGDLMRHILAGAISGLAAGAWARTSGDKEGNGSRPDAAKGFGLGVQAGQNLIANRNAALQQTSDADSKNQQLSFANHFETIKNNMASWGAKHAQLAQMNADSAPFIKDAHDYDASLSDPNAPHAVIAENLTADEAAKMMAGHVKDYTAMNQGTVSVLNPATGESEDHPTFAVLRSGATIPLSGDTLKVFALSNPAYAEAQRVAGVVPVTVAQANSAIQDQAAVHNAQGALDDLAKLTTDFPGVKQVDLMSTLAKDRTLLPAIRAVRDQLGTGKALWTQLDALRGVRDGGKVLEAMNITSDQADAYIQKNVLAREEAASKAKAAGTIENTKTKAELKPMSVSDAMSVAADPNATPEKKQQAQNVMAEKKSFDQAEATWKAQLAAANKQNGNMMTGSLPDGTQVAGTTEELKTAGIDPNKITKLPAADQSKVSIARQLISPTGLMTMTQKAVAAFTPEELTAIGDRWNEFAAGTLGSGDPRYIALRTDSRLLSTALMQAHVGAKGSEFMMEHFQGLADAGKMSGETLKNALAAERQYMTEKAMLTKEPTQQQQKPTDPAAAFGGKTRQ